MAVAETHLNHPYKNVRDRLGRFVCSEGLQVVDDLHKKVTPNSPIFLLMLRATFVGACGTSTFWFNSSLVFTLVPATDFFVLLLSLTSFAAFMGNFNKTSTVKWGGSGLSAICQEKLGNLE